mgnify:CR=1 FL=1
MAKTIETTGMNPIEAREKVAAMTELSPRRKQKMIMSLVTGKDILRRIDRDVPGGDFFFDQIDQITLPKTILNWLMSCKSFSEMQISFVGPYEPGELKSQFDDISSKRVFAFPVQPKNKSFWESAGKARLAAILAEKMISLADQKVLVALEIKKDGIYSLTSNKAAAVLGFGADALSEHWHLSYSFWSAQE